MLQQYIGLAFWQTTIFNIGVTPILIFTLILDISKMLVTDIYKDVPLRISNEPDTNTDIGLMSFTDTFTDISLTGTNISILYQYICILG